MLKINDKTKIFRKYQNRWIALTDDDRFISAGLTFDEALTKAARKGFENPVVTKMPDLKYDYLL